MAEPASGGSNDPPVNVSDQATPNATATRSPKRLRDKAADPGSRKGDDESKAIGSTPPSKKRRTSARSRTKDSPLISKLRNEIEEMSAQITDLTDVNEDLSARVSDLTEDNEDLSAQVSDSIEENKRIKFESAATKCLQCRKEFLEKLALKQKDKGRKRIGLLDLALEIRFIIYGYLRDMYSDEERQISIGALDHPISTNHYPTALLQVNHQLHIEAEQFFQEQNRVFIPINRRFYRTCEGMGDNRFKDAIIRRMLFRTREVVIRLSMNPMDWSFQMARELAYVFSMLPYGYSPCGRSYYDRSPGRLRKIQIEWYQVDHQRQGGQEFSRPWGIIGATDVVQAWTELVKNILANAIYRKLFNAEVCIKDIVYEDGHAVKRRLSETELRHFQEELSELVRLCQTGSLGTEDVCGLHEQQLARTRPGRD